METDRESDDEVRARRALPSRRPSPLSGPGASAGAPCNGTLPLKPKENTKHMKKLGDFSKVFEFISASTSEKNNVAPPPPSESSESSESSSARLEREIVSQLSKASSAASATRRRRRPPKQKSRQRTPLVIDVSPCRRGRVASRTDGQGMGSTTLTTPTTPRSSSLATLTPGPRHKTPSPAWSENETAAESSPSGVDADVDVKIEVLTPTGEKHYYVQDQYHYDAKSQAKRLLAQQVRFNNVVHLLHEEMAIDYAMRMRYPGSGQVHVFVDMSNIYIGFNDTLRDLRGIAKNARVPGAQLCFHAVSQILERGRSVGARELVGSAADPEDVYTLPEYFHEAEQIGYETSILRRVLKPARVRTNTKRNCSPQSSSSSSGEFSGVAARSMAYREQGVDEILQLKMANAAISYVGYPGTMVLATGDAEKAEYSDGFQKAVERILIMGWIVELVSWKRSLSSAWTSREWLERWGDRFRIIELDKYVEEVEAI